MATTDFMVHMAGYHMPRAGGEATFVARLSQRGHGCCFFLAGLLSGSSVYTFAPSGEVTGPMRRGGLCFIVCGRSSAHACP